MNVQDQCVAAFGDLADEAAYLARWCQTYRPDHSGEYSHRAERLRDFAAKVIAAAESIEWTAQRRQEEGR